MPFLKYFSINGKLPELNDLNEASKITEIAENLFNEYKNNKDWIIYEKIVNKIIRWTKAQISPIYSIIRGIFGSRDK